MVFSAVQPSFRLWAFAYATRFPSCLLFSADFWAAIQPWRPLPARIRHTVLVETAVAGIQLLGGWHGTSLTVGPGSLLSCAVWPTWVCHGRRESLANPFHLPFRHIKDVSAGDLDLRFMIFSTGSWFDLGHVCRSNVELGLRSWSVPAKSYPNLANQALCLFAPYSLFA